MAVSYPGAREGDGGEVARKTGLRIGKETPRRGPPLNEKRNVVSHRFVDLQIFLSYRI